MTSTPIPMTDWTEVRRLGERLDSEPLGGHVSVDAAYECKSGTDRCWRHEFLRLLEERDRLRTGFEALLADDGKAHDAIPIRVRNIARLALADPS